MHLTLAEAQASAPALPAEAFARSSGHDACGDGGGALFTARDPLDEEPRFQAADGRWFCLDTAERILPQRFGGRPGEDATSAIQAAARWAKVAGGVLYLPDLYLVSSEIVVPEGVAVEGPGGVKRMDQVLTTTTGAIASGSGIRTIPVASPAGLAVGQSIIVVSPGKITPFDPYRHLNPVIVDVDHDASTIVVDPRGGPWASHPAGADLATTCHALVLKGRNVLRDLTIDGNAQNQALYYWIATTEIAAEGSITLRGGQIEHTPSDAVLIGGAPSAWIGPVRVDGTDFCDIGCNGVHYGACQVLIVEGASFKGVNKRCHGINTAHQDGAVIFSNDCRRLTVTGIDVEDALEGVGSIGGGANNVNEQATIGASTFHNVRRPVSVTLAAREVVVSGIRATADFVPQGWPGNDIWIAGRNDGGPDVTTTVKVTGNQLRNGRISLTYARHVEIEGNTLDRRDMQDYADQPAGIVLRSSRDVGVTSNTVIGGCYGAELFGFFQTGQIVADVRIDDNTFTDQKWRGVRVNADAPGPYKAVSVARNKIKNRAAVAVAGYFAIDLIDAMRVRDNEIDLETGGAFEETRWTGADNRSGNVVGGVKPRAAGTFDIAVGSPWAVVANPNVLKKGGLASVVVLSPANAEAAALQASASALYVDADAHSHGAHFVARTGDGQPAPATARFNYRIEILNA